MTPEVDENLCEGCPYLEKIHDPYSTGDKWFYEIECTCDSDDQCQQLE